MKHEILISNIGLILSTIPITLHGIEVLFPMQARWIVNWVLPFFGLKIPNKDKSITYSDQIKMLETALDAAPKEKITNAKDYIFLLIFEQRQGSIGFIAIAIGAIYGLTLGLVGRNPLHLVFGIVAVLMTLVNANQAGLSFLGNHPKVSQHGRNVGILFTPFWAAVAVLNWLAFSYSLHI
ncbi:MAG: hypothetical protein AAF518_02655 [Spirochaetota bacterium]